MHRNLIGSAESFASPEIVVLSPRQAFVQALKKMERLNKCQVDLTDIQSLLQVAGFSLKARSRLLRLCNGTVIVLQGEIPENQKLWDSFICETHFLLRKIDEIRKFESLKGCFYISDDLFMAIGKLYCLRYLEGLHITHLNATDLRIFLMEHSGAEWFVEYMEQKLVTSPAASGDMISIRSVIKLIELYRDELMAPPKIRNNQAISDSELHEIEVGESGDEDEVVKEIFEAFNDFMEGTFLDELPKFNLVRDWFIATKPAMNKNQVKRGWLYFEKLSEKWSKQLESINYLNELMAAYPDWNCFVADHHDKWLKNLPAVSPYQIMPINTSKMLLDEAERMKHCVFGYLGRCISGNTRIFSVRDKNTGNSIATVELLFHTGRWNLIQLKGRYNQDLMYRICNLKDSLAQVINLLVNWYNQKGIPF